MKSLLLLMLSFCIVVGGCLFSDDDNEKFSIIGEWGSGSASVIFFEDGSVKWHSHYGTYSFESSSMKGIIRYDTTVGTIRTYTLDFYIKDGKLNVNAGGFNIVYEKTS